MGGLAASTYSTGEEELADGRTGGVGEAGGGGGGGGSAGKAGRRIASVSAGSPGAAGAAAALAAAALARVTTQGAAGRGGVGERAGEWDVTSNPKSPVCALQWAPHRTVQWERVMDHNMAGRIKSFIFSNECSYFPEALNVVSITNWKA